MSNKQKLQSLTEKETETKLTYELNEFVRQIYLHAESMKKELEQDPFYTPSLHDLETNPRVKREYRKMEARKAGGKTIHIASRIALALIPFFLITCISVVSVNALRMKVIDLLISINPAYTSIQLSDGKYALWVDGLFPSYLPEGFRLTDFREQDGITITQYEDDQSNYICLKQRRSKSAGQFNSEKEDSKTVMINDKEGLLISIKDKEDTFINLYWQDGPYSLTLECRNINESEVIKVAHSIKS